MRMNEALKQIRANQAGVYPGETPNDLLMAIVEEVGEIGRCLNPYKSHPEPIHVEIGDLLVLIIKLCGMIDKDPEAVLERAVEKQKPKGRR